MFRSIINKWKLFYRWQQPFLMSVCLCNLRFRRRSGIGCAEGSPCWRRGIRPRQSKVCNCAKRPARSSEGPREGARKATPSEETKILFNFIHYFNPIIKLVSPSRDFILYLNKKVTSWSGLSRFWKVASRLSGLTSIRLLLRVTSIFFSLIYTN